MKNGKAVKKMTNILPWTFIETKELIDSKRIKTLKIKWVMNIPEENRYVVNWIEQPFEYPSLDDLRAQFKATGLYTKERIDQIIKVYERLPKYRTGSKSTSRGKKRG